MINEILTDISNFCSECSKHESCVKEECILFRIEQRLVALEKEVKDETTNSKGL